MEKPFEDILRVYERVQLSIERLNQCAIADDASLGALISLYPLNAEASMSVCALCTTMCLGDIYLGSSVMRDPP